MKVYAPLLSVAVRLIAPEAGCSDTLAPGMTAALSSVTSPRSVAVWAKRAQGRTKANRYLMSVYETQASRTGRRRKIYASDFLRILMSRRLIFWFSVES